MVGGLPYRRDMSTTRWIDLEGTATPATRGSAGDRCGHVRAGVLVRSDNLQDLTDTDVDLLLGDLKLGAVIDLRTRVERTGTGPGPLAERVPHLLLSLIPEQHEVPAGAVLPDRWADGATGAYLHLSGRPPRDAVATAVRQVAHGQGASIVHCAAGKDRTGMVVAIVLEAVGVPRADVVADYEATNERIEGVYRRLLRSDTYAHDVARIGLDAHRVDRHTMEAVLDVVDERWGGAAAYLLKAGLDEDDLSALRRRLIQP